MTTSSHRTPRATRRWTIPATIWFGGIVAGWIAFFALLLFSGSTLSELWSDVRALALAWEVLVWVGAFPFVLALGVWETSWPDWVRVALVCSFAVGWSLASVPRATATARFTFHAHRGGDRGDTKDWYGGGHRPDA